MFMSTIKRPGTGSLLSLLLTMVLLLSTALPAVAESDAIGRIIAIRGQATAVDGAGTSRSLQLKSAIGIGERIKTGQRCRLQIMFADNTIVSLGPASEFQVKDYAWDAASGQGKMTSRVNEGVFRVLGGSITKSAPQNFLTETPSATIGIRGSMYAGRLRGGALQVVFQGGKGIFVKNSLGSVDITTPGFGTRLAGPKQAPVKPFKVPVAELEQLDPLAAPAAGNKSAAAQQPAVQSKTEQPSGDGEEQVASSAPASDNTEPETSTDVSTTEQNTEQTATTSEPATEETQPLDLSSQDTFTADSSTSAQETQTLSTTTDVTDPLTTTTVDPPQQTSTTDQLQNQTSTSSPSPPPPPSPDATFAGRFMAVQDDNDPDNNVADQTWLGTLSGDTTAGTLALQADTNNGVVPINDLNVTPYDQSQTYSSDNKQQGQLRSVTLLGAPVDFNSAAVGSDNTGEFAVFALDDIFGTNSYAYREIGFAGTETPSTNLPTSGIDQFRGPLLITLNDVVGSGFESFSYSFMLAVNWHNSKIFGAIQTPGPAPGDPLDASGFFFGDMTATGPANVKFIGMDVVGPDMQTGTGTGTGPGPAGMPLAIDGTASFGQLYGDQAQGVGFVANGKTYDVLSQAAEENWQLTAAGYRIPTTWAILTGKVNWEGFVVGVGEDMNQIDVNRRLYMNQDPSDFSLTIDRDAGTVTGNLTAIGQNDPGAMISGLEIGGSNGSAYIFDQLFATAIGGSNPIYNSPNSGPLKTYGNYLMTENPEGQQLASYASWGSWEIAYSEPGTGKDYHVHNPGSLWVAGEPTPAADITALATAGITGNYSGAAEGAMIPASGSFFRLPTGTCNLTVDFGTSQLTSGSINFPAETFADGSPKTPAINLGISPITIPGNSFTASINTPNFGTVNGAFFGPNAASVAGNFHAQGDFDTLSPGTEQVIGVFGGDR